MNAHGSPVTSVLNPLKSLECCRIAVSGRASSGKSTLADVILAHAHPVPILRPSEAITRSQPALLDNFLPDVPRGIPAVAVKTVARILQALLHFVVPQFPPCRKLDFLPAITEDGASTSASRIYDGHGHDSAIAIAHARGTQADVVLFVSRLDDSRSTREDAVAMQTLRSVFGESILHRMVIVLTHGCATPPADLSFVQFVHGRVHTLFRLMDTVFKPVLLEPSSNDHESTTNSEQGLPGDSPPLPFAQQPDNSFSDRSGERAGTNTTQRESLPLENAPIGEVEPDAAGNMPDSEAGTAQELNEHSTSVAHDSNIEDEEKIKALKAFEKFIVTNEEDSNESDGSVTDLPANFMEVVHGAAIPPEKRHAYRRVSRPPVVVAELAKSCPRRQDGYAILPDGTAWLPNLISTIANVATQARAQAAQVEERRGTLIARELTERDEMDDDSDDGVMREDICAESAGTFTQRMGKLVRKLQESDIRMMFFEVGAFILLMVAARGAKTAWNDWKKRVLGRQGGDDTLLEMREQDYKDYMDDLKKHKSIIGYHGMSEKEIAEFGELDEEFLQRLARKAQRKERPLGSNVWQGQGYQLPEESGKK